MSKEFLKIKAVAVFYAVLNIFYCINLCSDLIFSLIESKKDRSLCVRLLQKGFNITAYIMCPLKNRNNNNNYNKTWI